WGADIAGGLTRSRTCVRNDERRQRRRPLQASPRDRQRLLVVAAARELPRIALDDALRICLVLRDGDPDRYQRAAVRWLGRFALEARDVTVEDLRLAAEALDALRDRTTEAMERLQRLCIAHGVG